MRGDGNSSKPYDRCMAGGAERLTAERVSGGAVLAGQGRDTTFGVLAAQEGHNANAMQCSSQASHLARGHEGRKKEGRCQRDRALDEGSARGCSSDGCTTTTHSLARSLSGARRCILLAKVPTRRPAMAAGVR